jgi:hypothetical protein
MKWDIYKAKTWMLKTGFEHLEEGFYAEGGEMIFEAKWGDGCDTQKKFEETIRDVLCWEDEDIAEAVKEVMQ